MPGEDGDADRNTDKDGCGVKDGVAVENADIDTHTDTHATVSA